MRDGLLPARYLPASGLDWCRRATTPSSAENRGTPVLGAGGQIVLAKIIIAEAKELAARS
jgi:hypothetical protein